MPIIKDIGELCLAKHKVEITGINTSFLKSLPPKESAELLIAYRNGDKKAKEEASKKSDDQDKGEAKDPKLENNHPKKDLKQEKNLKKEETKDEPSKEEGKEKPADIKNLEKTKEN